MKAKHVIIVLFIFMLFQGTLFTGTPLTATSGRQPAGNTAIQSPVHTAGAGGENPLITNVVSGGGFEEVIYNGAPYDWSWYSTGYGNQSAAYTARRHSGNYAGELEAEGTAQQWGYSYMYYYPTYGPKVYLTQGIIFDFYNYLVVQPQSYCWWQRLRKGLFVRRRLNRLLRLLLSVLP